MKLSFDAECNCAQSAIEHQTMGASMFRRHLQKLFPCMGICPHNEDYCDTCRSNEIQLKRSTYIQCKIKESGNTKEEVRQLEEQVAAVNCDKSQHLTDAKQERHFFNKMTERCKEDWKAALRDELARHRFTLVRSADYQQAKLAPYWGQSPQPGSTYYLMKHSTKIFSIVDHRNDSSHTFLFSEKFGPNNTDHTVSFLEKYIESVQDAYPWI